MVMLLGFSGFGLSSRLAAEDLASSTVSSPAAVHAVGADDPAAIESRKLVGQLSAAKFTDRESAVVGLLSIGEAALPELERLLADRSTSAEAAMRAERCRDLIQHRAFDALAQSFLTDLDSSRSYGLPGWAKFSQLVGTTRTSKLMFLDMLRERRDLANCVETLGRQSPEEAALEWQKLGPLVRVSPDSGILSKELSFGEFVGLLFAASEYPGQCPFELNEAILNNFYLPSGLQAKLSQEGYRQCLSRLLCQWLPKTNPAMAARVLSLGTSLELPVTDVLARRYLSSQFDPHTRELAFQALAAFGDASDVAELLQYAEDTEIVQTYMSMVGGFPYVEEAPPLAARGQVSDVRSENIVRVNDLAVMAAMRLLGEDPRTIFPEYNDGLTSELAISREASEQRLEALRAWCKSREAELAKE